MSGNRNEFYQSMRWKMYFYSLVLKWIICCLDCAYVRITGSGTSTLDDLPDMFVGDMTIAGHIGPGECRSSAGYALDYPNPGNARTVTQVVNIPFKKPTGGKCYAKASGNKPPVSVSTTPRPLPTFSSISTSSMKSDVITNFVIFIISI